MDFSYRDKHYLRNALMLYISHLKRYEVGDTAISDDEFFQMQDDIMHMSDLLYEIEQDLEQQKKNAQGGSIPRS